MYSHVVISKKCFVGHPHFFFFAVQSFPYVSPGGRIFQSENPDVDSLF